MDDRENATSEIENANRKARLYFILAAVFLFVMAFVWSIDSSLTYLSVGTSIFFIFLGFWNLPRKKSRQEFSSPSNQGKPETPSSAAGAPFSALFKNIVQRKYSSEKQSAKPSVDSPVKSVGKARLISWLIFGIIFFFVFIDIFFSSEGTTESDYFQAAQQYFSDGQYDSSARNYQRAVVKDPANADALMGWGNALFSQEKLDSALLLYDKAVSVNPDLDEARYKKGLVYYNQKNYTPAAQTLKSLTEKAPNYTGANQLLGDVYYDQTLYDEAFTWYDKAYNNNPHNHWICYVLGYLYQTKGDASRAISLYKEALSFDSTEVDIYKRLGDLIPGEDGNFYRARATGGK